MEAPMAQKIEFEIELTIKDGLAEYLQCLVEGMRNYLVIECVKIARTLCEMDKQESEKKVKETIDKLESVTLALIREDEDPYSPMHSVIKYIGNKVEAKAKIVEMEKDLREIAKELTEEGKNG
jgi:hypothetical protein